VTSKATSILRVRGRLETNRGAAAEIAEATEGGIEIMAESLLRVRKPFGRNCLPGQQPEAQTNARRATRALGSRKSTDGKTAEVYHNLAIRIAAGNI
jgi:hypothetical protein